MQAADFSLNYDSKKLQYIKSDIDDVFVNNDENKGILNTSWVSLDDTDKNEIEYTFKVKKEGKTKFSTTVNGGFSTGQLEIPNNYNEGGLTVKIVGYHNTVLCVMVAGVLIIAIILLFSSKGRRKNKTKK